MAKVLTYMQEIAKLSPQSATVSNFHLYDKTEESLKFPYTKSKNLVWIQESILFMGHLVE